ncbi:PQQ-binding-like beta-propeller repeat protein, partial [Verrucomicrobiota bacterium]
VDEKAPQSPVLLWRYDERHAPSHAWREPMIEVQHIDFDYVDYTTIGNGMVYFGSSTDHKIYALDLKTGEERWAFFTEGPVRFAPVFKGKHVYSVSDDGYLYCLNADTGKLIWKFRGGPSDRKLIGNEHMISLWPARSGVIIENDKIYFAAGMWSREAVFIYCLNASDGKVIWRNDTSGFVFADMPHGQGFGGVSPQGYMVLHKDHLCVPCGRALPAMFDAKTGKLLWHENDYEKAHMAGSAWVMAVNDYVICKRRAISGRGWEISPRRNSQLPEKKKEKRAVPRKDLELTGKDRERHLPAGVGSGIMGINYKTGIGEWAFSEKSLAVMRGDMMILSGAGEVIKIDLTEILKDYFDVSPRQEYEKIVNAYPEGVNSRDDEETINGLNNQLQKKRTTLKYINPINYKKWGIDVGRVFTMLISGDTLIAGGREKITFIDFNTGKVIWSKAIEGNARGITVADGKVLASTTAGKIYCFAEAQADSDKVITRENVQPVISPAVQKLSEQIIANSGIKSGYCLMLGSGNGELLCDLIKKTDLTIYCMEPDKEKAGKVRKMLDQAGWQGARAAVHHGSFDKLPYNPYFANLIVWGDTIGSSIDKLSASELYRVLRPYGGTAIQLANSDSVKSTTAWLKAGGVADDEVSNGSFGVKVKRGKIPGSREWTHSHANIGRTASSEDEAVKFPLGVLWFGGPGPERIVERHARAPVPVFAGGVLYIQGRSDLIAVDAYNGREMWNLKLPGLMRPHPGIRGGNIVADKKHVYCIQGLSCLQINHAGEVSRKFTVSVDEQQKTVMYGVKDKSKKSGKKNITWEYLGITDSYVIGTLSLGSGNGRPVEINRPLNKYIFVFDKNNGDLLWNYKLDQFVIPTAIVADGKQVFVLDRTPEVKYQEMKRRGLEEFSSQLKALDLRSGEIVWTTKGVPPSAKSLMLKNGVIVGGPSPTEIREDLYDGVHAYSASNGKPLWSLDMADRSWNSDRNQYVLYQFIVGDTVYLPEAYDLSTGKEQYPWKNPLTGEQDRYGVFGINFCTTVAAAKNIVTYRSASVAFQEIEKNSGVRWLPEIRPSCWISVIPAGGLMLAPEGSSTCRCPYNYKTSVALYPVEREEEWSLFLTDYPDSNNSRMAKEKSSKSKSRKKDETVAVEDKAKKIKFLRLNLGTLGDRMDSEDRVWIGYPRTGEASIDDFAYIKPPVESSANQTRFVHNADYMAIENTKLPWLYTSGLTGPAKYDIQLSESGKHTYRVILHFAETEDKKPGQRVFDVLIQDKNVLSSFDIVKEAGKPSAAVIKEFSGIIAEGSMTIELKSGVSGNPLLCAFEIIEE